MPPLPPILSPFLLCFNPSIHPQHSPCLLLQHVGPPHRSTLFSTPRSPLHPLPFLRHLLPSRSLSQPRCAHPHLPRLSTRPPLLPSVPSGGRLPRVERYHSTRPARPVTLSHRGGDDQAVSSQRAVA